MAVTDYDQIALELINYHLSPATHKWALRTAELTSVRRHAPRLAPAGAGE